MRQHSLQFRKNTVKRMLRPGGPKTSELASEIGVATKTLYNWKSELGKDLQDSKPKRTQDWNPEQRLQVLFEAEKLGEKELGAFLRRKGLHSTTLQSWKEDALTTAKTTKSRGRPKKDPELAAALEENKKLKKDLRRKEKALAEQAALLILQKKVQDLLGEYEDDL